MTRIYERTLQQIGQSLLVTLPKDWAKSVRLRKGSRIKLMMTQQGSLLIAPEFTRKESSSASTIKYDQNFTRRFFREYFDENQTISILLPARFPERERATLYAFLKKFINIQIVSEEKDKIVVKCFVIDALSILECLQRMHYLSLNMLDEVMEGNDKSKIAELEDSLTRFYYLLVMQIRRFLTEGKYTEQNQIPLIRAMDCRMVAEKIERIADILKGVGPVRDPQAQEFLRSVREYYASAFSCFLNEDFGKALQLWERERKERDRPQQHKDIRDILSYARQISSLVR